MQVQCRFNLKRVRDMIRTYSQELSNLIFYKLIKIYYKTDILWMYYHIPFQL